MKLTLLIISVVICSLCFANSASPYGYDRQSTLMSAAFSSRDIDIIKEKINVTITKDSDASYIIEYYIKTDIEGKQIPLLFHAIDYSGSFRIWVDNQAIKLLDIPSRYTTTHNTPFEKFENSFLYRDDKETVDIYWQKGVGGRYNLNDLKYFEINLSKGDHVIRVEYTARPFSSSASVGEWINEKSGFSDSHSSTGYWANKKIGFSYSLSPARYWKSFGTLEITLNSLNSAFLLSTNLGEPTSGKLDSVAIWNFNNLPVDFFEINFVFPTKSPFAKTIIAIGPLGLTIIIALMMATFHFLGIKKYRKKNPTKKYFWILISGRIIIPFLTFFVYTNLYLLINHLHGMRKTASIEGAHYFVFRTIGDYIIILPLYWLLMWFIDKNIKRKTNSVL